MKKHNTSFTEVVQWIFDNSYFIEDLTCHQAYFIVECITCAKNNNRLDYTEFEIKILDVVVNYCYRFKKSPRFGPWSAELTSLKIKSKKSYLDYLKQLTSSQSTIRVGQTPLSAIIKDEEIAKLIKKIEQCSQTT